MSLRFSEKWCPLSSISHLFIVNLLIFMTMAFQLLISSTLTVQSPALGKSVVFSAVLCSFYRSPCKFSFSYTSVGLRLLGCSWQHSIQVLRHSTATFLTGCWEERVRCGMWRGFTVICERTRLDRLVLMRPLPYHYKLELPQQKLPMLTFKFFCSTGLPSPLPLTSNCTWDLKLFPAPFPLFLFPQAFSSWWTRKGVEYTLLLLCLGLRASSE